MATSTYPAAKAALVALLQNAAGLAGVEVSYGDPGIAKIELEHVFLGGTGTDGQTWAPYGQLKRDEQYTIELFVHAAKPGSTQQEATERAHVLFGVVESTIRPVARTATQIAPGMYEISVAPKSVAEYVIEQGYACFIAAEITCKARI